MPATFTATSKNASIAFKRSTITGGGLLTVHGARYTAEYAVLPFTTDFAGARAFRLQKLEGHRGHRSDDDGGGYDVLVAHPGSTEHSTCSCPSGVYRPNSECKHVSAMKIVLANKWLDAAPEEPVEAMLARIERVAARQFAEPSAVRLKRLPADPFLRVLCSPPVATGKPARVSRDTADNGAF